MIVDYLLWTNWNNSRTKNQYSEAEACIKNHPAESQTESETQIKACVAVIRGHVHDEYAITKDFKMFC